MLVHNDHNWQVAFSGHCETSRMFVDSSTSACSTMTLAGNWHMSSSSHLLSTRYLVDGRYCSYWCYNDNVTWWGGGMERRGGGRWRQDDWQLLVSTLRWLRDPRLQDYYHLFQISAVLLGSQCALWWGLCDICVRGCVTDGSMVWLCSTYLLPPPAKSHHRLLPPITTTTSTNNNQ